MFYVLQGPILSFMFIFRYMSAAELKREECVVVILLHFYSNNNMTPDLYEQSDDLYDLSDDIRVAAEGSQQRLV